jgi:hypothetical protein
MLIRYLLVVLALISAPAVQAAARTVSFDELAKHPQRYHGETVAVTAWLQVDTAHMIASLRPRPHADMSDLPEILLDCQRWLRLRESRIYAAACHRVHVVGRFEFYGAHPTGWGGIFDKQITKISTFEVVK